VSVKAHIGRDEPDPAHISEIPLAEGALNGLSFCPKPPKRGLAIIGRLGHGTLILDRMPQNLPNAAHDIGTIAARKAMDEDRVSSLPDREAWRPILVRRTAHHGVSARPGATQAFDDRKRFGGGL
jgi:hypothetical protein